MAFGYNNYNNYNNVGFSTPGGAYPPPMLDQLAQFRGAQMPPMQPLQNPQQFGGGQLLQNPQQLAQPLMQQPQQPQAPAMTGPVYVSGEAGAKGYLVAAGQTVMLIDADPDAQTFWLKSADASGMPSMRTFDYTERVAVQRPTQAHSGQGVEYVTRADFDRLAAHTDALEQELGALKAHKCTCGKKSAVKEDEVDGKSVRTDG